VQETVRYQRRNRGLMDFWTETVELKQRPQTSVPNHSHLLRFPEVPVRLRHTGSSLMGGWSACARLGQNVVMDGKDALAPLHDTELEEQNLTST
jgi:hypothetical protein